jgi:hypothetical protein
MRRKTDVQPSHKAGDSGLKNAKGTSPVRVRAIRLSDFQFIRGLSATIQGYTVPPPYILWMLTRFQGELCLIAEDASQEPLGYMLAMSDGIASSEIFIWQWATNYRGQRVRAGNALASHVRKLVKKHGIERITFTAVPDSAGTKAIASLAKQTFAHPPRIGARLPRSISATEHEFHLLP